MKKLILFHSNPLQFGGVDTFDYNFCKKMRNKYDITFMYFDGYEPTIERIRKLGVKTEKYDETKKYVCDICLLASSWGGYPENIVATSGRYIQMVHADYEKAIDTGFVYKKWHKTTEHVGVSDHVCKIFKKMYPTEKITRIYNILDTKQKTKPILKLISATRISPEKGYERMLKLAKSLKKAGVKFRWTIFTDLKLYGQKPFDMEEFVYMTPRKDLFDYVVEADYAVQLSDTEGYSYFINECLQYGTPVICTDFPSAYESVEDGVNGYILKMDLSNLDVDKIINHIPKGFKYIEKGKVTDWVKLLSQKVTPPKKKYKVEAIQNYTDKSPELIINNKFNIDQHGNSIIKKGDIYYLESDERAKQIKYSGLAKVTKL